MDDAQRKISLLGSTGSIGTQTLDIVAERSDIYEVTALAAGGNIDLLAKQIVQFRPKVASVQSGEKIPALKAKLTELGMAPSDFPELVYGMDGVCAVGRGLLRLLLARQWMTGNLAG